MMRRQGTNFTMSIKDGNSVTSTVTLPSTVNRVNIIKKGMKMYYQTDLGTSNDISSWNVNKCFSTGATFGSIINASGNYDRILKGTLSHLKIQIGS